MYWRNVNTTKRERDWLLECGRWSEGVLLDDRDEQTHAGDHQQQQQQQRARNIYFAIHRQNSEVRSCCRHKLVFTVRYRERKKLLRQITIVKTDTRNFAEMQLFIWKWNDVWRHLTLNTTQCIRLWYESVYLSLVARRCWWCAEDVLHFYRAYGWLAQPPSLATINT